MGHGTGGSARGRMAVARASLLAAVVLLATLVGDPVRADDVPLQPIVLPPGSSVQLTVGGARRFSATVTDEDVEYRWTVDGERVGTDRAFEYAPESRDIGAHEVAVTVLRGSAAARHVWRVTVDPPPVPKIIDVAPTTALVRAKPGERVKFRYIVTSSVATDEVSVVWTVDGERAGEGTGLTLEVEAGEPKRVRAVASSALGVVQAREWRLVAAGPAVAAAPDPGAVEPDEELTALLRTMRPERGASGTVAPARPTTTVRVAVVTTTSTAPTVTTSTVRLVTTSSTIAVARAVTSTIGRVAPTTTTTRPARIVTTTRPARVVTTTTTTRPARIVTTTTTLRRPPPTPSTIAPVAAPPSTVIAAIRPTPPTTAPPVAVPARPGITRDEVVAFLERYARAYESRSVGELQRIGQISGAKQAEALGRYFEQVRDLRVDVRVLEVASQGDAIRVRYRRRDRFRDPTGRVVDKETPAIEKLIRRTPNGLVFTPSS